MQPRTQEQTDISLASAALELVWPTRCCGCERAGKVLCDSCAAALNYTNQEHSCPRCGAPFGSLVCTECYTREGKTTHIFSLATCTVSLDELAGRIIVLYKDNNERRLASVLAVLILEALPIPWLSWTDLITWIPVDRKVLRQRGFDHMKPIATELARLTGIPAKGLLRKKSRKDQRRLGRQERLDNLKESFSISEESGLQTVSLPPHVLLIDDVLTTGATLDAAALKLKESGVQEVRVASFARTW